MSYKTVNGLMKHLRSKGIKIKGSKQKRQLINNGYFHGYKGYRYFKYPNNRLPFTSYKDINSTIDFDLKLKALLYPKIMYIETALKSIVTEILITNDRSYDIRDMLDKAVLGYKNCPYNSTKAERDKYQKNKLDLEARIRNILRTNYNNNSIKHYYQSGRYDDVPIWALINIMTFGDLGHLIETFTFDVRNKISNQLNISNHYDQQRQFIYHSIFLLKDLRNAIAHNGVIFDARFRTYTTKPCVINTIRDDINLNYISYEYIDDYIISIVFVLKKLGTNINELASFIENFQEIIIWYQATVDISISSMVIKTDLSLRVNYLMSYIKTQHF